MLAVKRSTGVIPEENLMIFSDYKSMYPSMDRQLYTKDCTGRDEKSPRSVLIISPLSTMGMLSLTHAVVYDRQAL